MKAFHTVTYENIYPGIDLVFRAPGREGQPSLHYDFIVHPGADHRLIQLKYYGNHSMLINPDGSLRLNTSLGYVEEAKPVSFLSSDKKEIVSGYAVSDNRVSFNIPEYDRSETLIIDPTLIWGTYFGGEDLDEMSRITLDSENQPLITGNTTSSTNIATTGVYQTTYGGDPADLYLAKFNITGQLEWASYFGGDKQDLSYGVAADSTNDIFIIGKSTSDGLATQGQTVRLGSGDAVIAKFNPTGQLYWSTYKGGIEDDHYRSLVIDETGNLYLVGYTESDSNISTPGSFQEIYGGNGDCMISQFTSSGFQLWTTYYGGTGTDRFHASHLDLFDHLLAQGTSDSETGIATAGVHQDTFAGGDGDVILAQFSLGGNRLWCTYYGGEFSDRGRGVETDSSGNIYIGGLTESETGIGTPGSFKDYWTEGYYNGGLRAEDAYLAKFTPTGQIIWGTYYGGTVYDRLWGMTLDRNAKAIYAVGGTTSEDSMSTPDAWQPVKSWGGDGFFSRWDYDGNLIWGSYLGAVSEDHLEDVEIDKDGFIYLAGKTSNTKMPSTPGVHQTLSNGDDDAVVYKFYPGFDCYDYSEPNNDFNTAKLITAWSPLDTVIYGYNGGIVNGSDQDWYQFKVDATYPNMMIVLSEMTQDYDIYFYDDQQTFLQSSASTGTINDTITINTLPAGSFFYIQIGHSATEFDSINCYRLKVYMSDSVFSFPTGANGSFNGGGGEVSLTVFPNPATQSISFNVTSAINGKARIIIYDVLGRIATTKEVMLQKGYQEMNLSVASLPSGVYTFVLESTEKNRVSTFVKQSE